MTFNCESSRTRFSLFHIFLKPVFLLLSLHYTFITHGSALATIDFQWEAGIDVHSGLAYSSETSRIAKPCNCLIRDAISKGKIKFSDYPQFLGRKNIMFGLLRAKSSRDRHGHSLTMMCAPILDISLISFGEPSITVTQCRNENYLNKSCEYQKRVSRHCVMAKIPIVGGLLVCGGNTKNRTELNMKATKMRIGENHGEIRLQLTLPKHGRYLCKQNELYRQNEDDVIQIETRVVDYSPSIAGRPPIGNVRRFLYRHSQSYLHAYVMWRFHNHCYNSICKRDKQR